MTNRSDIAARRWRLALGRYAQHQLGGLSGRDGRINQSLDYLYGREYAGRGIERGRGGSLDPSHLQAIRRLNEARDVFAQSAFETLHDHALSKYKLSELLSDRDTLQQLEPNQDLLKELLSVHDPADPAICDALRSWHARLWKPSCSGSNRRWNDLFSGTRNRFQRFFIQSAANFDWCADLRQNLPRCDPQTGRIIAERLRFNSRSRRKLPCRVVLCVDQSGSMTDSLIHSAIMAAILSGLPGVDVKMILFDTSILDVTDWLTDPIGTLLAVQLGGGTNIARAVSYAETLVDDPTRTVLALITDFEEGTSPRVLYAALARLNEARVRLIGLTALGDGAKPYYDALIAGLCVGLGMQVGAMTPDRFADWLAGNMQ